MKNLESEELERLVMEAKRSQAGALSELCGRFYPQLYRFMLTRVPTREDAEDLTGEVCTRALESLPRQQGFFPAWIYRIANNLVADFYRRRKVRDRIESGRDEEIANAVPDKGNASEEVLLRKDLEKAMDRLTADQQDVIRLRFMEGYSTTEIAEIHGKLPGAIRALQFRALETLRDKMKPAAGGGK